MLYHLTISNPDFDYLAEPSSSENNENYHISVETQTINYIAEDAEDKVTYDILIHNVMKGDKGDRGDNAEIKHDTTANWDAARGFIPQAGEIIIYDDYRTVGNAVIAGIKIGDGSAYVQDLPFTDEYINESLQAHIRNTDIHTTLAEKAFWNNKINIASNVINDTLIITRN